MSKWAALERPGTSTSLGKASGCAGPVMGLGRPGSSEVFSCGASVRFFFSVSFMFSAKSLGLVRGAHISYPFDSAGVCPDFGHHISITYTST